MTLAAANKAQPWRVSPTILPNVYISPAGITKIMSICTKLVRGVGFSNGCEELAPKNPPPLVPTILMASWEATGPCAIVCVAPSTVLTFV